MSKYQPTGIEDLQRRVKNRSVLKKQPASRLTWRDVVAGGPKTSYLIDLTQHEQLQISRVQPSTQATPKYIVHKTARNGSLQDFLGRAAVMTVDAPNYWHNASHFLLDANALQNLHFNLIANQRIVSIHKATNAF